MSKHASVRVEQQHQEMLLSERRKYPEVFKWKVGSIIIGVLILIFLGVNIFMIVYLQQHQLRKNNYTFVVDLLHQLSSTNLTALQFANMASGLANSNNQIWFQDAKIVDSWEPSDPGQFGIARGVSFFQQKVVDRFTVVRFTNDAGSQWLMGAFTHVPFQVPEAWEDYLISKNKEYYTFEIDERKSSIVGGQSSVYLKMDGNDLNLTKCRTTSLNEDDLKLLQGVQIRFFNSQLPNSPYLEVLSLGEESSSCFSSNGLASDFLSWFKLSVGSDIQAQTQYKILDITTFELQA